MCQRMQLLFYWLSLWAVLQVESNTFIWEPNSSGSVDTWKRPYSSFSNPPVCVTIPANLTLCHGIKYTEMRLPNLMHHDTLNEVIDQSSSWLQLTKLKCHPDTQLFLCSLFSPVCLAQTIPPCRSLCQAVQTSCEPHMRQYGYSWPDVMRCDLFPVSNNMCIESQANMQSRGQDRLSTEASPERHSEESVKHEEDEKFFQQLLETICNSDWVIKSGINSGREGQIRIKKYKLIYGNLTLKAPFNAAVNKSSIVFDNPNNLKRRDKYVIVGSSVNDAIAIRLMVRWVKNTTSIKKALRRAKSGEGCRVHLPTRPTKASPKRMRTSNRRKHSPQRATRRQ